MTNPIHFGACCACGTAGPTVRNLLMLPYRAITPGQGWGCVQCGLPSDGAVAVVCDACLASGAPLIDVIDGWPAGQGRVPRARLTAPFDHDPARHPGETV